MKIKTMAGFLGEESKMKEDDRRFVRLRVEEYKETELGLLPEDWEVGRLRRGLRGIW